MPFKHEPGSPVYAGLHDDAFRTMHQDEKWRAFRRRIWERDRGLCRLCGQPVALSPAMHIDHVVPRALGGPDHWDNLRIVHAACNQARRRHTRAREEVRHRPDGTAYTRHTRSFDAVRLERLRGRRPATDH